MGRWKIRIPHLSPHQGSLGFYERELLSQSILFRPLSQRSHSFSRTLGVVCQTRLPVPLYSSRLLIHPLTRVCNVLVKDVPFNLLS